MTDAASPAAGPEFEWQRCLARIMGSPSRANAAPETHAAAKNRVMRVISPAEEPVSEWQRCLARITQLPLRGDPTTAPSASRGAYPLSPPPPPPAGACDA